MLTLGIFQFQQTFSGILRERSEKN